LQLDDRLVDAEALVLVEIWDVAADSGDVLTVAVTHRRERVVTTEELVGSIDQMNLELRAPRLDRNRAVGVTAIHSIIKPRLDRLPATRRNLPRSVSLSSGKRVWEKAEEVSPKRPEKWPRTKPGP
jgi:hypothetical protein